MIRFDGDWFGRQRDADCPLKLWSTSPHEGALHLHARVRACLEIALIDKQFLAQAMERLATIAVESWSVDWEDLDFPEARSVS